MSTQIVTPEKNAQIDEAIRRFIKASIRPNTKTILCLDVIEEALRDSGRGIPEGHYAATCGLLSLGEFQSIIALLKFEKKVSVSNHYVTWIG